MNALENRQAGKHLKQKLKCKKVNTFFLSAF